MKNVKKYKKRDLSAKNSNNKKAQPKRKLTYK